MAGMVGGSISGADGGSVEPGAPGWPRNPPGGWWEARPWQTNAALGLIGLAMVGFTRQLISEYDHFTIGFSGVSSSQLALYGAALLIFLIKPLNVNRYTLPIILGASILCRLVALYPEPALSSDVYRYAWDGVVQHAGINPYRYVPGDAALTFLRAPNDELYMNMNRRDYAHTIYPPAAQMMFYLITWISPTVTFMKTAMVLLEGVTLWGLMRLLREMGVRREWRVGAALLYAWCPLLIWEIGGSGHVDALVMAWLVWALVFRYRGEMGWAGVFLGLAVLTKFYPLVLFPAMYRRGDWKMPAVMAGLAVACYAVYLSVGKAVFGFLGGYVQEEGMETGTRYFPLEWAQHLPGLGGLTSGMYTGFCGVVFAGLTVWAWQTCCRRESGRGEFLRVGMGLGMALMLLFSPHYPWYVAWLVPFLVLVPSLTVFTYVCGLFYLCYTALAVGSGPKQFLLNETLYSVVIAAAVVEIAVRNAPWGKAWLGRMRAQVLGAGAV